jgi:DUF3102 family protein
MSTMLPLFDYAQLDPEVRSVVVEATKVIQLESRQAASSIVAIGEQLVRVKDALGHGHYLPWLKAEFGWSERQARNFVQAHEWVKSANCLSTTVRLAS